MTAVRPLRAGDLDRDPFRQFHAWFAAAGAFLLKISLSLVLAVACAVTAVTFLSYRWRTST